MKTDDKFLHKSAILCRFVIDYLWLQTAGSQSLWQQRYETALDAGYIFIPWCKKQKKKAEEGDMALFFHDTVNRKWEGAEFYQRSRRQSCLQRSELSHRVCPCTASGRNIHTRKNTAERVFINNGAHSHKKNSTKANSIHTHFPLPPRAFPGVKK